MAVGFADRVQETTPTTGTGTLTLGGAAANYQSFASAFSANGASTQLYYGLSDGTNWEVGIGTYTVSGNTLSRQYVLASSNAGALVSFSGPSTTVWNDLPAAIADGVPQVTSTAFLVPVNQQMLFVSDLQLGGDLIVNGILQADLPAANGPPGATGATGAAGAAGATGTAGVGASSSPTIYQPGGSTNVALGIYNTFAAAVAAAAANSSRTVMIDGSLGSPTTVSGTLATALDNFTLLAATPSPVTLTVVNGTVWTFSKASTSLRIGAGLQLAITASSANTISLTAANAKMALILDGVNSNLSNAVGNFQVNPVSYGATSAYGAYINFTGSSTLSFILVGTTATLTVYQGRGSAINSNGGNLFNYSGGGGTIRLFVGAQAYLSGLIAAGSFSACILDVIEGDPSALIPSNGSGMYYGTVTYNFTPYPTLPILASGIVAGGFASATTYVVNPGYQSSPGTVTSVGTVMPNPYRLRSVAVTYTLAASTTMSFTPVLYVTSGGTTTAVWTGATTAMTAGTTTTVTFNAFPPYIGSAGDIVTLGVTLSGAGPYANLTNLMMSAGS